MRCPVLAFAALGIVVALAARPAAAQRRDKDKKEETSSTQKKKAKNIDFPDGDDIDGNRAKSDGEFVVTTRVASHSSLIRIRADFVREILKSADNL